MEAHQACPIKAVSKINSIFDQPFSINSIYFKVSHSDVTVTVTVHHAFNQVSKYTDEIYKSP